MRILRPFIVTVLVVPFVMPGLDLHGTGLLLELAGVVAGVGLGVSAALFVRVEPDPGTGSLVTVAGAAYAAVWVVVGAARLLFVYESSNSVSFGRALGSFLITNHISVTALADSIMFVGFAMLVANRAVLFRRSRGLRAAAIAAMPAASAAGVVSSAGG